MDRVRLNARAGMSAVPAALLAALIVIAGCGGARASVIGSDTELHLSGNWNDADSRAAVEEIVPQCLGGAWLDRFQAEHGRAPVVRVAHVTVRVQDLDDVVEPGVITDDLVRALVVSGRVRAVASREEATVVEGARDVRREMAGNAAAAPADRQELAADFILGGALVSQNDQARDTGVTSDTFRRVKFYQLTLTLTDVTSDEIAWSGQCERKKTVEQSSITF